MIELPKEVLSELTAYAREGSPREVCGWLAGKNGKVTQVFPVPNVAEDPLTRFLMSPEAQLHAMREIAATGLGLVGTYHSHPRTSAAPSIRDMELAAYPDLVHIILSLAAPEPEVRCYRIAAEGSYILEPVAGRRPAANVPQPCQGLRAAQHQGAPFGTKDALWTNY